MILNVLKKKILLAEFDINDLEEIGIQKCFIRKNIITKFRNIGQVNCADLCYICTTYIIIQLLD